MASIEGIRLKINKFMRLSFSNYRQKKIKYKDFTIISNNCWGGMIYESYNLKKQSPTVGLFFMSSDYIKFISNLKEYLECELEFIDPIESKYYNTLKNTKEYRNFPIGRLKDIEIMFLHYKSENEALEKWNRRKKRINYKKLIIKFNDQNGCSQKDVEAFFKLNYENKIFFTTKKWKCISKEKYIRVIQLFNKNYIYASKEPYGNKITKYINNMKIKE